MPGHKMEIRDLRQILERTDLLLQKEFNALHSHWNATKQGFHTNAETRKAGKVNLTTTCFGLFVILRHSELLDRFFAPLGKKAELTALNQVTETITDLEWVSENLPEFNVYTTPIVVQTLYQLAADPWRGASVKSVLAEVKRAKKISDGLNELLKATEKDKAARFPPYEPNAYLTFWCFAALRSEAIQPLIGGPLAIQCRHRALELAAWAEAEMYQQLAFSTAGDLASFDPIQLAYALRIYTEHQTWRKQRVNRKVVTKVIATVFKYQNKDGLWPKSRPLFHFSTRGSVYPFTFEMIDILIGTAPKVGLLEPYLPKLEASLRWAEENYLDGEKEKGWRNNHLPYGSDPEGWSTAAVLIAVRKIREVVSAQINEDLLDYFRAQRNDTPDDSPLSDNQFYDADVPSDPPTTLKTVLRKYLIEPHKPGGSAGDRRYSAVFYGPPGTAKTTLAMAVAKALGWPYIYLQTSDFAGEGVHQVIGKARAIFDRLSLLERAVILFDEVEEFVRDRKAEPEPSSRMLTTSMLSLIQDLRSKKGVIFIVATNFLDKFDAAISRTGGRFDMMVLISPPSQSEKQRMFRDHLATKGLPPGEAARYAAGFDTFVGKKYHEIIYQFAYTEWKLAVDAFIEDILAKKKVEEKSLEGILKSRAETIALSDKDLREAFNVSKKFVRF
jgi:Cdc6-like AAA superfamily ATPase